MKSIGKILGLVFLGLLLIVVGLGFALTHLFDPNDYKDEIRQLAHDKANLEPWPTPTPRTSLSPTCVNSACRCASCRCYARKCR